MNRLRVLLRVLAAALFCAMCATVARNYCTLKAGAVQSGFSAPPGTAFWLAIPYAAGILLCLLLAAACQRRYTKQ